MNKVRLGEICKPKQWKTLTGKELISNGKYPVYGANGIIGYYNEYNHEKETLLIGCRGTCGALNICVNKSYVNGNAMALDNLREDIDVKFLYYALMGRGLKDIISGAVQPQIIRSDLEKIEVLIGTKAEQKDIIEKFDAIESVISLRRKELEKLDELIKARFVELFGDPVSDTKNWGQKPLKEMLESIRYGTSSPPKFSDEGYAFIRATNIKNGRIVDNDMKFIPQHEADRLEKCKLLGGEIIIVRSGVNAGNTCVVTPEYSGQYAGYDMILVLNESLNPVFFNTLINTTYMEKVVKPMTRRAAQPHLNSAQTQSFPIICVPKEQQDQFAAFVKQVDKSKVVAFKAA